MTYMFICGTDWIYNYYLLDIHHKFNLSYVDQLSVEIHVNRNSYHQLRYQLL